MPGRPHLTHLALNSSGCTHALVWPWAPGAVRAEVVPALTDGTFLLPTINEALSRTALLVQPLHLPSGVSCVFADASLLLGAAEPMQVSC